MKIAVLGAGVVGVTAAYQLLKDGHEVVVIDRADGPATFTSFANAGLVAPGHAYSWASPAAPGMMLRSLWRGDQAIRFRPKTSRAQWRWVRKFLAECDDARARMNTERKSRLCIYSQEMLRDVVAETGLRYDGRQGGLLYFYRTTRSFEAAARKADLLRKEGLTLEALDPEAVVQTEPALAPSKDQIAGALYAPTDESGDANLFTSRLAEKCVELGASFRYETEVASLVVEGEVVRAASLRTPQGAETLSADAFVLCLGVMSPHLARQLGIDLPIYPVKGYSVTLPITDQAAAPRMGGVDENNLLAYCPMGARLRITATAEIGGYSNAHKPSDFRHMLDKARALFGHVADFSQPKYWAGLRPMTPTGLPVIDRSKIANVWLNTGHGHMGWTMSNGSARVLADLIAQRRPAIEREGMRYDA